jgi:Integrase core domain
MRPAARAAPSAEYVHVAVDDHSRLAYAEVLPDEKATTAIAFLRRALAYYRRHGITVERVLTDNGSAYLSTIHALSCRQLGIRHLRTRPRRPQTKPNASSAPSLTAGPTAPSTAQAANVPPPSTAGSGTTTIDADTQPSAANRPSTEPTSLGPTTSGGGAACSSSTKGLPFPRPSSRLKRRLRWRWRPTLRCWYPAG